MADSTVTSGTDCETYSGVGGDRMTLGDVGVVSHLDSGEGRPLVVLLVEDAIALLVALVRERSHPR